MASDPLDWMAPDVLDWIRSHPRIARVVGFIMVHTMFVWAIWRAPFEGPDRMRRKS